MKAVITPDESARLDELAGDALGSLMDRAGFAVAATAAAMGAGYGSRVVVLAGPGNNGGDGYVAARHLRKRGADVTVHALVPPATGTIAAHAAQMTGRAGVSIVPMDAVADADLVIDAVFGVGGRPDLPEVVRRWTETTAPVLAVDLPSGVDATTGEVADTAFTAQHTVTFHALKPGHVLGSGPQRCGDVDVVDIGFGDLGIRTEPEFMVCDAADALRPARPRDAHKWSAGSVAVVGGSPGLTGAPLLAATSAIAMGAGAVTMMVPGRLQGVYAAQAPGIMTRAVGSGTSFVLDDVDEILDASSRFDVMVLEPGLGLGVNDVVRHLVLKWSGSMLLDADGLNALPGTGPLVARQSPTVITPHAREFTRLTGRDATYEAGVATASDTGDVVLMKGAPTLVFGELRWAVTTGGQELATIGTGDVLAGVIAALWARGLDPESAALSGAYWHGCAGASLATSGTVTAPLLAAEMRRFAW